MSDDNTTPLSPAALAEVVSELDGWTVQDGWLTCTRTHESFVAAMAWVQRVGGIAEELNHHPDIDIRWRTVTLRVRTHDAGDQITMLDIELARRLLPGRG